MDGRYILSCMGVVYDLSAQEVYLCHSAIFKFGISKGDFHVEQQVEVFLCRTPASECTGLQEMVWGLSVYTDHCLSQVFVFDLQRLDGD